MLVRKMYFFRKLCAFIYPTTVYGIFSFQKIIFFIGMGAAIPLLFPSTQFWSLPVVTTVAEEAGQSARLIAYGMYFYCGGVV
jgi:hypothetical protein